MLEDKLRNKQVTIYNLIDVIKNFTVIEKIYTRNKDQETNKGSKGKNDAAGKVFFSIIMMIIFYKLTIRH